MIRTPLAPEVNQGKEGGGGEEESFICLFPINMKAHPIDANICTFIILKG